MLVSTVAGYRQCEPEYSPWIHYDEQCVRVNYYGMHYAAFQLFIYYWIITAFLDLNHKKKTDCVNKLVSGAYCLVQVLGNKLSDNKSRKEVTGFYSSTKLRDLVSLVRRFPRFVAIKYKIMCHSVPYVSILLSSANHQITVGRLRSR